MQDAEEQEIATVFDELETDDSILKELVPMEKVPQHAPKVILIHGWQGTGKTHFGYAMVYLCKRNTKLKRKYPKLFLLLENGTLTEGCPVVFYDTEAKSYDIYHKFQRPESIPEKDWILWMKGYVPAYKAKLPDGEKSLLKLIKLLHALKRNYTRGTVVIDTVSDINTWILHYIKRQILNIPIEQKLDPKEYEHRNNVWQYLLHLFREVSMNIVLICRHKYKWGVVPDAKGKKRLSKLTEWKIDVWEGVPFMVHFELSLDKPGIEDEGGKTLREAEIFKNYLEGEEVDSKKFENLTPVKFFDWIGSYFPDPEGLEELKAKIKAKKKKKVKKKKVKANA